MFATKLQLFVYMQKLFRMKTMQSMEIYGSKTPYLLFLHTK